MKRMYKEHVFVCKKCEYYIKLMTDDPNIKALKPKKCPACKSCDLEEKS